MSSERKKIIKKQISIYLESLQFRNPTSMVGPSYGCGNDDIMTNVCDEIIDNLFLGDIIAASDKTKMEYIDVIINLTPNKTIEHENKKYIHIPLLDSLKEDIKPVLSSLVPQILDFISQGKKVFVHCMAGISRSVSIVIGCIIVQRGITFIDALLFVRSKRTQKTCPNFGFELALKEFEKEQGIVEKEQGIVEEEDS